MKLDEVFEISNTNREEVLLMDFHNLCMRCLFALPYDPTDEHFVMYKTTLLRSLKKIIKEFKPNRLIFCLEGYDNWRKQQYDGYKASRAAGREKSVIDFDRFFAENNQFVDDMKKFFKNVQFIQLRHLEADDLIALITKNNPQWNITCVSSDRDFHQLHKYKWFKQYDVIKERFVEVLSPETELTVKIITGDKGDDVPPLKKGVGPKTIAKILDRGLDEWLDENQLRESFERNMKLISFDCIPQEFNEVVVNEINNWQYDDFKPREFYNFIVNEGLGSLFEITQEFIEIFKDVKCINCLS